MTQSRAHRTLERLLDQRSEHPERIPDIDARIRATFEEPCTIMVIDMAGFSRLTIKYGIVHYLAMIRRMHNAVLPLVKKHRGHVFKTEADNVFARFKDVPAALKAAAAILDALAAANAVLPADWDVEVGIGVGFGPLLVIGEHEVWGSEMNLASKLGEDVAKAGEILLTEGAFQERGRSQQRFVKRKAKLGKLAIPYYVLQHRVKTRRRRPSP